MGLFVNTNVASLQGRNQVDRNQNALTSTLQKLSSGLRINSSKDDAAGMAVAEGLTSRIRGNDVAIRNANDAISMVQTGESALTQIITNVQRIRDIAVQSTSSALQDTDRSKLQTEVDQLTQEIGRITQTTEFNGNYMISGGATITFQVGASGVSNNQISFAMQNVEGISLGAVNISAATGTVTGASLVNTSAAASALVSALDTALGSLVNSRAQYGALQNRFEAVISNVKVFNENLTSARSRIQDADFAAETANLTKQQILQQAGTAMLAQANQVPQSALSLLR
jgi:flagellin